MTGQRSVKKGGIKIHPKMQRQLRTGKVVYHPCTLRGVSRNVCIKRG